MAVTEAASGEHALEQVRRAQTDVVVLDVRLPGRSGLDVLREVRAEGRDVQVIRRVWAPSSSWQQAATVTEHVRRLRIKLEDDPATPRLLSTVRGSGYRFDLGKKPGVADRVTGVV